VLEYGRIFALDNAVAYGFRTIRGNDSLWL
jgi:hypothetical protein